MHRRHFLQLTSLAALAACLPAETAAPEAGNGFFRLTRQGGRDFLLDPAGQPFFSLAMNHLDPVTLRHADTVELWREKYSNSMQRWLTQVREDLLAWGFNSVGWVPDVATKTKDHHRHSRSFTFEEYQWLGLPYCHQLPFADFHHYESEMRHPDFFSQGFADWCDYVARDHCLRMAEDPLLIGYFYVDCPAWIHHRKESDWKGPIFDPERMESEAGKKELFDLARQYYRVTYEAVRRYDPYHLILGDRYEANRPWTPVVFEAAKPYVDVMSFQNFSPPAKLQQQMAAFARLTGKPVLIADAGVPDYGTWEQGFIGQDTARYAETLAMLPQLANNIGFHFCGAYLRNRRRKYGLRDEQDRPTPAIGPITQANQSLLAQWPRAWEEAAAQK